MNAHITIADRMKDQAGLWESAGDKRAVFLSCYAMMTENMLLATEEGRFRDAGWVNRLLHLFAGYYFDALELYESDAPVTPLIWRHTHDATLQRRLHVLQSLLLGVNAHINYDLALALSDMLMPEWRQLSEDQRQKRYADHLLVNDIIAETIDAVQDEVVEKEDPFMNIVDVLMGRLDERLLSGLITRWRAGVWEDAHELMEAAAAGDAEPVRVQLENKAMRRAGMMLKFNPH